MKKIFFIKGRFGAREIAKGDGVSRRGVLGAFTLIVLLLSLAMLIACGGTDEPPCAHEFGEWRVTSEPTCTLAGKRVRTCMLCQTSETATVPAKGHSAEMVPEVPATCQNEGASSYEKCKDCGKILTAMQTLPKAEHTPVNVDAVEPTCSSAGKSAWSYCLVCNEVITKAQTIDPLEHTPVVWAGQQPSCEVGGFSDGVRCGVCQFVIQDRTVLDAKGHTPVRDEGKEATCLLEGLSDGSHCGECNTVLVAQQIIAPKGHSRVTIEGKAASCTEEGLTDGASCDECGAILEEQQPIPKASHSTVADYGYGAKCGIEGLTDGEHCTVCGEITVKQEVIPALTHSYIDVEGYDSTCTEEGLTDGVKCKYCGTFSVEQQVIAKKEHAHELIESQKAECDISGYELYSCSVCGNKKRVMLDALEHKSITDPGRPATTEQAGLTDGAHCELCGKVLLKQTTIPRLAVYTVTVSDPRMGSVNITSEIVTPGETIFLKATPSEGYGFLGWYYVNGTCASNDPEVTLEIWNPDSAYAIFNAIEARFYQKIEVRVEQSHDGPEIVGEGYYSEGDIVTLSVSEHEGMRLDGWYVNGERVSTKQSYTFTLGESAPQIEVRFEAAFRLDLLYDASLGSVEASNRTESGYVYAGDEVYLKVTASATANFEGIYKDGTLLTAYATYRFTMPSENAQLEIIFTKKSFTVHLNSNTYGVELSGDGTYPAGEVVSVKASEAAGYRFVGWIDAATQQTVSTAMEYSFLMEAKNLLLFAQYEACTYRINIYTNYEQLRIQSPDRDFRYGDTYTLTAPVVSGYYFVGWYVNGEYLGQNQSYEITIATDVRATAKYAKYYNVYATINLEGVGELTYPTRAYAGSSLPLKVKPYSTGYYFRGWYVADQCVSEDLEYNAIMPEGDLTIEARFEKLYTITVIENKPGVGTWRAPATARAGESITLKLLSVKSGYEFRMWYLDNEHNTSNREYTFTMPEQDVTLELVYRKKVKVTLSSNYELYSCSYSLPMYEGEAGWIEIADPLNESLRFDGYFINGECVESGTRYEFVAGEEDIEIFLKYTEFFYLNVWSETEPFKAYAEREWNEEGALVKIWADTPDEDHVFRGWYTGNMECISTEIEFTFVMPAETKYIYAVYDELRTVTLTTNAPSALVIPGEYRVVNDFAFSLVAEERIGDEYLFDGWYVDGVLMSRSVEYIHYVLVDVTIEARYYQKYTLSVTHREDVAVTGEGKYLPADSITLTASTENSELSFIGWSDGTQILSREYTYSFIMPASDVTLKAIFVYPWDGTVADGFEGGDGSEENPYLIRTAEQLAHLASVINSSNDNTYYNKHFRLISDIDLGGREWTPIGIYYFAYSTAHMSRTFAGHFDGDGFQISNYKITKSEFNVNSTRTWPSYVGLFGYVTGEIRALSVFDFDINISVYDTCMIGGLAGVVDGGCVTDCTAFGDITVTNRMNYKSNASVGLLLGQLQSGTVMRSDAYGDIKICSTNATELRTMAGALIGYCATSWDKEDVGFVVADCYTNAIVAFEDGAGSYTHIALGGFIGEASYIGDIYRCTSGCYVTLKENGMSAYVGGFVGYLGNTDQRGVIVKDCHVQNATVDVSYSGGHLYVGGFVGESIGVGGSNAQVSTSYATAKITVKGTATMDCYVGGFVGLIDRATLRNCLATVDTAVEIANANVGPFLGGVKNTSYLGSNNLYASEGSTTEGGTTNEKYKPLPTADFTAEFFLSTLGFDPEIWATEHIDLGVNPYLR